MRRLRYLLALLAATAATVVAGSIVQTQFNLAALGALGLSVPLADRAATTLQDLLYFAPMLAAIVLPGFIVAFVTATWLAHRWPAIRGGLFVAAGACALLAALLLMQAALGLTVIAAARGAAGCLALLLCAGLGGGLYARLTAPA